MRMSALGQKQTLMQACLMCGSRGFLLAACLVFVVATVDAALAQPFGMTRSAPPAEVSGFGAWVLAKQGGFYRMLSSLIRAAKADGSAAYTLLGVSFLYGVFHAAGPGHGKAVISSYLIANNETWRRGLVLSFASAMLQALVAVAIVGVAAAPRRNRQGDEQYSPRN
jgi:nickel/cobalt transporter (NicO) family protein